MRPITLAFISLFLFQFAFAQDNYRDILSVDPEMANGYFIVDQKKADALNVSELKVDLLAAKALANGSTEIRILESITIRDGEFGKLDPTLLSELTEGETAHYHLKALTADGTVVVERDPARSNGDWAWPEQCRLTCRSNLYAWSLVSYANYGQQFIELVDGTNGGSPFYFYVPIALWTPFEASIDEEDLGLGETWSELMTNPDQTDIVHVDQMPPGALMLNGYPVSAIYANQPGWAIRLDKGPWRNLWTWTETYSNTGSTCATLLERYNSDALVILNRGDEIPPVTCAALPVAGGGISWGGSGPFDPCSQTSIWAPGINGNVVAYAQAYVDCHNALMGVSTNESGGIHSISMHEIKSGTSKVIISAVLPSNKDPKLVPIPKTVLEPGLYETRIILDNGTILRHYEDLTTEATVHADFAAFVNIKIYPVPVQDKSFAIDLDLLFPMSLDLTIVNNMGVSYHTESLNFEFSGQNKHVVEMDYPWPNGVYHAIFQSANGGSQSVTFNVDM